MSRGLCIIHKRLWGNSETGKIMSALVAFIRKEMEDRNWTQLDLSEKSSIPDSTLSRLLSGQVKEPKLSVLYQLAIAFGMPLSHLMAFSGFPAEGVTTADRQSQRLIALTEAFPWLASVVEEIADLLPEDREAILAYLETMRNRRARSKEAGHKADVDIPNEP